MKKTKAKAQLCIFIPHKLHRALRKTAFAEERCMSDVVRDAIELYLTLDTNAGTTGSIE